MNKYSLLIFDWDGTLFDSKAQIVACMQAAITELSLESKTDQEVSDIIGLGLNEAVQRLYPKINTQEVNQLAERYRSHYLSKERHAVSLFNGAEETLNVLKDAGYDLAVATGKSRRGLDSDIAETGVGRYFPITRCADETRSKPHPQMLEEILVDYNTTASKALMIGDSEFDLQLANNIKMDALAVSYGVHGLIRLLKQDPVGFIDDIKQLPTWLENHG